MSETNPATRVRIIREEADRLEGEVAGYTHKSPQILAGLAIIQSMRAHADVLEREGFPPCRHGYDWGVCGECYPIHGPKRQGKEQT